MRLAQEVKGEGLATITRSRSALWPFVKLTEAGEMEARRLCGMPNRLNALLVLEEILASPVTSEGWVNERSLMRPNADRHDRYALAYCALPGCWRGWLELHSDTRGGYWFRELPAGVQALRGIDREPAGGEGDREAWDFYDVALAAAIHQLGATQPKVCGEIGLIPLSASMGAVRPRGAAPTPAQRGV